MDLWLLISLDICLWEAVSFTLNYSRILAHGEKMKLGKSLEHVSSRKCLLSHLQAGMDGGNGWWECLWFLGSFPKPSWVTNII